MRFEEALIVEASDLPPIKASVVEEAISTHVPTCSVCRSGDVEICSIGDSLIAALVRAVRQEQAA